MHSVTSSRDDLRMARELRLGLAIALALLPFAAKAQHPAPPDNLRPWIPAFTKYTMASGVSSNLGTFYSCGSGTSALAAANDWAPKDVAIWNQYWSTVNEGTGWWLRIKSETPQSCQPLVRSSSTEILEAGLGDCPDRNRRVGYTSPYDYRNNPANYQFRTNWSYPGCSVLKATEGFNPWAGGAWSTTETINVAYNLYALCPEGWYSSVHAFTGTTPWCLPLAGDSSPNPFRNAGRAPADSGEPKTCNPISIGTGNKYVYEPDYSSQSVDGLSWERHYNHLVALIGQTLSQRWTHSYSRWISTLGTDRALMYRADGRLFSARLLDATIAGSRQRWAIELNARGQLWRTFGADSLPTGWVLYASEPPASNGTTPAVDSRPSPVPTARFTSCCTPTAREPMARLCRMTRAVQRQRY